MTHVWDDDEKQEKELNENNLVRIFWPVKKFNILKNYSAFIKTPEIILSKICNDNIDEHGIYSDIFVYVVDEDSISCVTVSQLCILYIIFQQFLM